MTALVVGMVLCLAAEAFFAGSELAMVSVDRLSLEGRASEGHRPSARVLQMLKREDRLITTCLIGTNLSTITGTTLMAVLVTGLGWPGELALLYVPLTVVFGEALPKTVFQHHANMLAPALSAPLQSFQLLFLPLLGVLGVWSSALRRVIGRAGDNVTREDIVQMLEGGTPDIQPSEHQMIRNLFELPEVVVEEVMTPLVDVAMLSLGSTVKEAVDLAVRSGYSRIPVYQDRVDNIVGLMHISDLLWDVADEDPVDKLVEPVRFVPESKRADDLLHEMRRNHEHFVVVVDEYGGSVGIVTIEDLLEEFVGEIHDERDERTPAIRRLSERAWRVPARTEIHVLEEAIGRDLPEGDYETAAGLVLARLGRIPRVGELCRIPASASPGGSPVGDLTFQIEEATDRAIVTLHLTVG